MKRVSRAVRDDIAALHACGHSIEEIMQQTELSRSFVYAEMKRRELVGAAAARQREIDAVRLYSEGLKIKEVAVLLRSSNGTIGRIIAKAGIGRSRIGVANPRVARARRVSVIKDGLKFCTKCFGWKVPSEFPPSKNSLDGYRPRCNSCHNRESLEWRCNTPAGRAYAAGQRKEREAALKQATPKWVDLTVIEMIYLEARRLSRVMIEHYTVDHIVPIRGVVIDELGERPVCGLHVPANLRVMSRTLNARKGNKLKE